MRVFNVRLFRGNIDSLYNIYYDTNEPPEVVLTQFCKLYGTLDDAENITFEDLSAPDGVDVEAPENSKYILVTDLNYEVCELIHIVDCNLDVEFVNTEDFTQVPVVSKFEIFIPEGFSPNNDNINDTFKIVNLEYYPNNKIDIYYANRFVISSDFKYGDLVFTSTAYHTNWWNGKKFNNGIDCPVGPYIYSLVINNKIYKRATVFLSR